MITAKDIQQKKFEKVKFGYSPEEVDSFLSLIEDDINAMQKELDDANDKIELLADKVREYKESEEDIKNALLLAQKQSRQVVTEAKEKAETIVREARESVESVKAEAIKESEEQLNKVTAQLQAETESLVNTQHEVSEFKRTLFDMYKQHLELISALPETAEGLDIPELDSDDDEDEDEEDETEESGDKNDAAPVTTSVAGLTTNVNSIAEAEAAAAAAKASSNSSAAAFDGVAQSTFGSRRDDARIRDDAKNKF